MYAVILHTAHKHAEYRVVFDLIDHVIEICVAKVDATDVITMAAALNHVSECDAAKTELPCLFFPLSSNKYILLSMHTIPPYAIIRPRTARQRIIKRKIGRKQNQKSNIPAGLVLGLFVSV